MIRYFYKVDGKGQPIPGTNNSTANTAFKGPHIVFFDPICCSEDDNSPTTNPIKYFVRLDGREKPISNTLVRSRKSPLGKWMQVGPICCRGEEFGFSFTNLNTAPGLSYIISIVEVADNPPTPGIDSGNTSIPTGGVFYATSGADTSVNLSAGTYTLYVKTIGSNSYTGATATINGGTIDPTSIAGGLNSSAYITYIFNFEITDGGVLSITLNP